MREKTIKVDLTFRYCDVCGMPCTRDRKEPKEIGDTWEMECKKCGDVLCKTCWNKEGADTGGMYSHGMGIRCGKCLKVHDKIWQKIRVKRDKIDVLRAEIEELKKKA